MRHCMPDLAVNAQNCDSASYSVEPRVSYYVCIRGGNCAYRGGLEISNQAANVYMAVEALVLRAMKKAFAISYADLSPS